MCGYVGLYNRNGTVVTMLVALTSKKLSHMHILTDIPSNAKIKSIIRKMIFGNRIYCPHCKSYEVRKISCRFHCKKCRKKFSILSGSWLAGMKITYRQMWILLACWQNKKDLDTASELARVSIPTARRWYRRFQYNLPYEKLEKLTGEVEVDEAFVGRKRHGNQRIVLGAYERGSGNVCLEIETSRSQEITDTFILNNIEIGSTVFTDCFSSYHGIDHFFGYVHKTCNHSKYVFGPTNHIEATWSSMKRYIRRTWQQIRAWLLPYFIKEFEARINEPELFKSPKNYLTKSLTCSISFT